MMDAPVVGKFKLSFLCFWHSVTINSKSSLGPVFRCFVHLTFFFLLICISLFCFVCTKKLKLKQFYVVLHTLFLYPAYQVLDKYYTKCENAWLFGRTELSCIKARLLSPRVFKNVVLMRGCLSHSSIYAMPTSFCVP